MVCFFKINSKFILIILIILLSNLAVYADDLNFNFYRDTYKSFETVQMEVFTENISLTNTLSISNLELLSYDRNPIALAKNIVKVNNSFYVYYFDLPNLSSGTYDVRLRDISYVKDDSNLFSSFSTSLEVVNSTGEDIVSIRPGYSFAELSADQETSFTIVLNNKGNNAVSFSLFINEGDFFSIQENSFGLLPGESKNIGVFSVLSQVQERKLYGNIRVNYGGGSYDIPLVVIRASDDRVRVVNESGIEIVDVSDAIRLTTLAGRLLNNLSISLDVNEYYPAGQIVVNNNAGVDLHNVSYSLNNLDFFEIDPEFNRLIIVNSSAVVMLSVADNYNFANGKFRGSLDISSLEGATYSLPIFVSVSGVADEIIMNEDINETIQEPGPIVTNDISDTGEGKAGMVLLLVIIGIIILLFVLIIVYKKTRAKKEEFENFVDRIKERR